MSCRGGCQQGRRICDRYDCEVDPLDRRIATRFVLVIVVVWAIMLIALIGALWK